MPLGRPFSPALDGGLVAIGDGSPRKQAVRFAAGEVATPFWMRTESGLVLPVAELPFQAVIEDGQAELLSMPPQALDAGTITASAGDEVVTISQGTAPSGGFGARTLNLYRSTSSGTKGALLAGDVSLPFADDTVTNGTTYWYTLEVVDSLASDDTPQVGATPQASGGLTHPNEPAGFVQIVDQPFDDLDPDTWDGSEDSQLSIVTDANAPLSPSNVGACKFPEGFPGGSGPINYRTDIGAAEFYLHFGFKVSSNWVNHGGANAVKIFFVRNNGNGDIYFKIHGSPTGSLRFVVVTQNTVGGGVNYESNLGGSNAVVRGVWYDIEVVLKSDSSPGAFDGEIHVWMDDDKTHQYTDASLLRSGADRVQDTFAWNPTYGGGSEHSVPEDMFQYVDHIYISGPA